jgi:hypothetical protein
MSVYPHRHDNAARIYRDKDGRLWVTHTELLQNGYRNLEDFDIVYLNDKFYELSGYAPKANSWWLEEVEVGEDALPETPPE